MVLTERITRHYFPVDTGEDDYECTTCDTQYTTEEEAEDCCTYEYTCDFCGEVYSPVPGFSREDIERAAIDCCSYECSYCLEVYHASKGSEVTSPEEARHLAEDCCPHGVARPAFQ